MLDPDAIAVREEGFDVAWNDSERLRADHEREIGPRPGVTLRVNVPLFQRLDSIGALLTMTARSNGRMFGYLLTIIGPSLENAEHLVGTQTAFYVSPEMRGAGWQLQRGSIEALRARGVHEVLLRSGTRGPSLKLGSFYRRLGAAPYGELYSLMLGGE